MTLRALFASSSLMIVCSILFMDIKVVVGERITTDHRLFDPAPVWPLCGRITEQPPRGWAASDGCPPDRWGNPYHSDYPMTTSFGPRLLPSQGERYDFHRGIDLPVPEGTPVFAMAKGIVRIAGRHEPYRDALIQLRHFRPGSWGSCLPYGCYHTLYLHLSSWVVAPDQVVDKGQLIGYSGVSSMGHAHLHFEIRDAPAHDPYSIWQRDSIHPLRVLPYLSRATATSVTITDVDVSDPVHPQVEVEIFQSASLRLLDVNRIEVEVYDKSTYTTVPQTGQVLDRDGYYVYPPWFDFEQLNRMYTHKDSSHFPWPSFDTCPFSHQHPSAYDAHAHLCNHDPKDHRAGFFNGVWI
ncbi:MAG: M23 family metallopeptidase, partial [Myxococcota bacterium]